MRGWDDLFLSGLAAAYPGLYAESSSIDLSDPDEVLIAVDALRRWRSDVVSRHSRRAALEVHRREEPPRAPPGSDAQVRLHVTLAQPGRRASTDRVTLR